MRKRHTKEFKAKVALEALKENQTIQEIATKYEIHSNMVSLWKKQLAENIASVFGKPGKEEEELENKSDEYLRQIGKLQVENDYLKKKYRQIYGVEYKS